MQCIAAWMACLLALSAGPAVAADWFPYPVERTVTLGNRSDKLPARYQPLATSSQPWRLCAALPHRKDDYWRAVDWGLQSEAKRIGVQLDIVYAGGYDQLAQQIRQLQERCGNGQYHAVIIGAVHERALNPTLATLAGAGLPLIDLINGIDSPHISARARVAFTDMGAAAADYVNALCARERRSFRIAWFPGPQGAGWVRDGDAGFRKQLRPNCGQIVHSAHGDTGLRVQTELVQTALKTLPDLDLVVGTAVTAEAASHVLRGNPAPRVRTLAYYLNASVFRGLRSGRILAAPTDAPVIQARIAIDLAVRILEKQPYEREVGSRVVLLDHYNIYNFHPDFALAPEDLAREDLTP